MALCFGAVKQALSTEYGVPAAQMTDKGYGAVPSVAHQQASGLMAPVRGGSAGDRYRGSLRQPVLQLRRHPTEFNLTKWGLMSQG